MALSRTDRERYVLVAAALDLEAKAAQGCADRGGGVDIFFEAMWANRCRLAATTIRELLERREKEEPMAPAIVEGGTTPQARKV